MATDDQGAGGRSPASSVGPSLLSWCLRGTQRRESWGHRGPGPATLSGQAVSEPLTKADSSSSGPTRHLAGQPTMGQGGQRASGGCRLQIPKAALKARPTRGIPPEVLLSGSRIGALPVAAALAC